MIKDSRTSQRFDVHLEVELVTASGVERARTRNASLGGIYIESGQRLAAGSRVELRLYLPTQKEAITAAAVVRWCDGTGIGVQFEGLRAKDVWALGKYFGSTA